LIIILFYYYYSFSLFFRMSLGMVATVVSATETNAITLCRNSSNFSASVLPYSFRPSFRPSVILSFRPPFYPFRLSFLIPSVLSSVILPFRPSFFPFLLSFRPSFLPCLLPPFPLPSFRPHPTFLPSFLRHVLASFFYFFL
jgi:hypothetical protein